MITNKLGEFYKFLNSHLEFTVCAWERSDIDDKTDIYSKDFEKLRRYYVKYIRCGNHYDELYNYKNEAIQYIHDCNNQYRESLNEILDIDLKNITDYIKGFFKRTIEKQVVTDHKKIKIQFDDTYYDYYSQNKHEEFKKLETIDYRKISEYLDNLFSTANVVKEIAEKLTESSRIKTTNNQYDIKNDKFEVETGKAINEIKGLRRALSQEREIKEQINSGLIKSYNLTTTFSFNKNIEPDKLGSLLNLLYPEYINTDPDTFKTAFSGKPISSPLNIMWMKKNHKGELAIRPLIYLLQSALFDEITDKEVFKDTLLIVFCDSNGQPLKRKNLVEGLRQFENTKSNSSRRQQWKSDLDNIIELILSDKNTANKTD